LLIGVGAVDDLDGPVRERHLELGHTPTVRAPSCGEEEA
jgi:hypothetical protein